MKHYTLPLIGVLMVAVLLASFSTLLSNRVKAKTKRFIPHTGEQNKLPAGWKLGQAIVHENLTLFPVIASETISTEEFITLEEGLKAGKVKVTEITGASRTTNRIQSQRNPQVQQPVVQSSDNAEVNRVMVTNNSGKTLVLIAGEIILGGKQDRIVGHDCIVASTNAPVPVDVYCVEHGRWQSHGGANAGAMSFGTASNYMAAPKVRSKAQAEKNQSAVWEEVADKVTKNRVNTSTGTLNSVYSDKAVSTKLAGYEKAIKANLQAKNIVGAVVAINGKVMTADVFASPGLFLAYKDKLLRSYALEAVSAGKAENKPVSSSDAEAFLSQSTGDDSAIEKDGVYRISEKQSKDEASFRLEHTAKERKVIHYNKVRKQ
ncbi:MAG: DUF6569 family protein [Acidobacteriota bacterium]